jgi:hypothetical protein
MAGEIPRDMMAKRAVLYSDRATDEDRNALADAFLDARRFGEAVEILEKTRDPGRIAKVERAGIETGDTFLLLQVERLRKEPLPADRWREAFRTAKGRGRLLDAWRALEKAGDEEGAEAFREEHLPDHQPYRPDGK